MIKFIISFTRFLVGVAIALLVSSCDMNVKGIKGSGNVTTETRTVNGDFTGVEANRGLDVVVEQSDSKSITVEADDNLQSHIKTSVENGILVITSDFNSYSNATKKVTVKMPIINSLETNSGSNLNTKGVVRSENLTLKSSSGSELNVNAEAENIISEASSGSHMSLEGKALKLEISSSSGSGINAKKLIANEVDAQSSSGSNLDVHAVLKLDAKASSGSSVNFSGSPKTVSKQSSSGGSVSGN